MLRHAVWCASSRSFVVCGKPNLEANNPETGKAARFDQAGVRDAAAEVPAAAAPAADGAAEEEKSDGAVQVLVPLIDLANHAREDATAELRIIDADKDDATFALFATRPLRAGEQVTISYSAAAGSVELLSSYGFVPAGGADGDDDDGGALEADAARVAQAVAEGHVWSTSIADDEALLAAGVATPAMTQAVRLRLALKRAAATAVARPAQAAADDPAP